MTIADKGTETYSDDETKRRAEATLKVMLATPHKPHKAKSSRLAARPK
ncbi:hypothetical protein [Sphingomonas sp.]|nr:hypothetical protein [Sphingomonas sp.]